MNNNRELPKGGSFFLVATMIKVIVSFIRRVCKNISTCLQSKCLWGNMMAANKMRGGLECRRHGTCFLRSSLMFRAYGIWSGLMIIVTKISYLTARLQLNRRHGE